MHSTPPVWVSGTDFSQLCKLILFSNLWFVNSTLAPGSTVTYNGTDSLLLDPSTGLVKEVTIAQDLLTLFHGFGWTSVPL